MINEQEIYKNAIKTFGQEIQILKAIEELTELSTALFKILKKSENAADDLYNVLEEIVDVGIMLEQLKLIYHNYRPEFYQIKQEKLTRLQKLIEEKTACKNT